MASSNENTSTTRRGKPADIRYKAEQRWIKNKRLKQERHRNRVEKQREKRAMWRVRQRAAILDLARLYSGEDLPIPRFRHFFGPDAVCIQCGFDGAEAEHLRNCIPPESREPRKHYEQFCPAGTRPATQAEMDRAEARIQDEYED